jgi:hypothetical protein
VSAPAEWRPWIEGEPSPVPRRRRWWPWALLAAVVLLAGGIGVALWAASDGSGPGQRPLTVKFGLIDDDTDEPTDCARGGNGGYSDIGPGMPLTVRDQDNRVIAAGSLPSSGEVQRVSGYPVGCIWTLQFMVPAEAEHYTVDSGDRGSMSFSRTELAEQDWTVEVGLSG